MTSRKSFKSTTLFYVPASGSNGPPLEIVVNPHVKSARIRRSRAQPRRLQIRLKIMPPRRRLDFCAATLAIVVRHDTGRWMNASTTLKMFISLGYQWREFALYDSAAHRAPQHAG